MGGNEFEDGGHIRRIADAILGGGVTGADLDADVVVVAQMGEGLFVGDVVTR